MSNKDVEIFLALGVGLLIVGFGLFALFFWIIGSSGNSKPTPPPNNNNDNNDNSDNGGVTVTGKFNIKAMNNWNQRYNTILYFGSSKFSGDAKLFKYDPDLSKVTYIGVNDTVLSVDFNIPKADTNDPNNVIIHYYVQNPGETATFTTVQDSKVASYKGTTNVVDGTVMWLVNYSTPPKHNNDSTTFAQGSYWTLTSSS